MYLVNERGIKKLDSRISVASQRVSIVFMHLTGFLILAYRPGELSFDLEVLKAAGAGLAFLLLGQVLVSLFYKNSCPLLWNGMFFLLDLSIIVLQRVDSDGVMRQLAFIGIGFGMMLLVPIIFKLVPKFEKLEFVYLIAGFILLILPFFFPNEKNGSLNWVVIGSFSFQPSEIVKFLFVFYLSSVLRKSLHFRDLIFPGAAAAVFVLILVLQNDLGGALIFFMTFMVLLYISTGNKPLALAGMLAACGASWAAYRLFSHVQTRIVAWQNPWADPYNRGHQILQSLFALGTWGLLGSGLTRGIPGYVPVVKSDFIFAAICEEFGGIFGMGVIGVFMLVFYRGVNVALRCKRPYYSLLAAGFTSILAFQSFLILGGVIKFIPLTGVTLPFVSSGGSSAIVCIAMIGILEWIFKESAKTDDEILAERMKSSVPAGPNPLI
jgi:cell division protein FtsW (lipid II flippase)